MTEKEWLCKLAFNLFEVGNVVRELMKEIYEKLGSPYGEGDEGVLKWLSEIVKKANPTYSELFRFDDCH